MTLSKSRFEELQELWKRKKRESAHARVSIVEVPADMIDMSSLYRGGGRPERLRGSDLVRELARLALEWSDRRFAQCARALFDLGVVDKQSHNFTKKRGSHVLIDKPHEAAEVAAMVRTLRERDPSLSEREACANVTAGLGCGATFEAGWEQVRNASRRARKAVGKRARG